MELGPRHQKRAIIMVVAVHRAFELASFRAAAVAFLVGYVGYEYVHHVCHGCVGEQLALVRALRRQHMRHHYLFDGRAAFGVSTPLMDVIMGTSSVGSTGRGWPRAET
jgi:sterol desaturase/sphingolipid hydroxylase (fatty acid hydroxylase superfamily)